MRLEDSAFAERADPALLPEWMDGPCSREDLKACLRDLEQVNVVTLAHAPTLAWIESLFRKNACVLRVVDVGCGGGDMLRHLARWAGRRGFSLRLTGIDLNPVAIEMARERTPAASRIEWIAGDIYTELRQRDIDVVISSLMTHHLRDEEIVRFLRWMEATARVGWFVNDLYRSEGAHRMFGWLAGAMRWHRFVRHDGPVSIRRSFREADWERLCAAAEVGPVQIAKAFPSRLCVGRVK